MVGTVRLISRRGFFEMNISGRQAVKRSLLVFFFGDFLFSFVILVGLVPWLKSKIVLFDKYIDLPGYNLLLVLWNFFKGFENVLPASIFN